MLKILYFMAILESLKFSSKEQLCSFRVNKRAGNEWSCKVWTHFGSLDCILWIRSDDMMNRCVFAAIAPLSSCHSNELGQNWPWLHLKCKTREACESRRAVEMPTVCKVTQTPSHPYQISLNVHLNDMHTTGTHLLHPSTPIRTHIQPSH